MFVSISTLIFSRPFTMYASLIILFSCLTIANTTLADPTLEEITIFSTLDQTSTKNFIGSVSIVNSNDIRSRDAQNIDQLLATIPNTNFSGGASRGRFVQVRGIGDIEQFVDPKAYPSVGLIIDGIELNGLFGAGLLFDAEQVEVLRGPQGTRLGASALAGSINIISGKPTETTGGYVQGGIGKFDAWHFGAAYHGALSDNINGRLAVQQYNSDGYIRNNFINSDRTGKLDELTAKIKLDWQLNTDNELALTVLHVNNDNGYDAFSLENIRNTSFSDNPGWDQQEINAFAITHTTQLSDSVSFQSKLSVLNAQTAYAFDEDWTDLSICDFSSCPLGSFSGFDQYQRDKDEYVIDIRMLSNDLVFGIYAQDRQSELDRNRIGDFPLALVSSYDSKRYATYGQWTPQLSDQLQANVGARFEKYSDDYNDSDQTDSESRDELWSFEAGLRFDFSDNGNIFALLSRGNKAGGVNTDASTNINAIAPIFRAELQNRLRFESESLTNIELGVNSRIHNDSIGVKASVFYNKRNNPQFETFLYDSLESFLFVGYQDNAESAESNGAEIQLDWQANDSINVIGNISYIDTSIKTLRVYDFDQFAFISIDEKDQPRAASYQYHIAINSRLSDTLSTSVQLEGRDSYEFAYYFSEESGNTNLLHASVEYASGPMQLTLWMRNILDDAYPVHGLYFGNDPRDSYTNNLYTQSGEPRNFGLTARYSL